MAESAAPELSQPFEIFEQAQSDEEYEDVEELCAAAHLTDAVEVMRSLWMN